MAGKKRKPKRRYSDEERASALAALAANGGNGAKTAAELGIPEKTLNNWANGERHPEAAQMGDAKKPDLAAKLEEVAWKLAEAIPGKIEKAPLQQLTVSMGIAIDKMRLLRNEPTNITRGEYSDLSGDEIESEIKRLASRTGAPPGPPPGASPS